MIKAVEMLVPKIGIRAACRVLDMPRSRWYRKENKPKQRGKSPRALSNAEREEVHQILDSPRFMDQSPRDVCTSLLDEKRYLCSYRTMYRILHDHQEVRERRNQLRRPIYQKPELLAKAPNQVWSWDITKLRGPVKWSYFYLYVVLDIYSRYVVGWMIALQEAAHLAQELVEETYQKEGIQEGQLTLHSDRGNPMTSKTMAFLLADLGVTKSYSRPYVSNDNPFSEAQFKTMKYRPSYPKRFGSLLDARAWAREFFFWYNQCHYHSGIALLTPAMVHSGCSAEVLRLRQATLESAYNRHPERFVRGLPKPQPLPEAVWINPPHQKLVEDI
jgi:putative transposase